MKYTFLLGRSASLLLLTAPPVFGQQLNLDQNPREIEETASQQRPVVGDLTREVSSEAQDRSAEAITFSEADRETARGALENAHRGSILADREVATALEAVNQALREHLGVFLKDIVGKLPDQAGPAVQRAQQLSKTGGEVGLERLRAIRERRATEEVHGRMTGPPEDLGKAKKVGPPVGPLVMKGHNR